MVRVRVEKGRAEKRAHRILNKARMADELRARFQEIAPRIQPNIESYLHIRSVRHRTLSDVPHMLGFENRMAENPDVSLALVDVLETLKGYEAQRDLEVQSLWGIAWNGRPRFTLRVRLVSETAHKLAAEVERIVTRVYDAYGPRMRRKLRLDIVVIEKPVYVSPRLGLKALEASRAKERKDQHAAMRDVVSMLGGGDGEGVVIDQPDGEEAG